MAALNRSELIELTQRIQNAEGSEGEIDELISCLESNVPHPRVLDLIFHPADGMELSAEHVVDQALSHRAIAPPAK